MKKRNIFAILAALAVMLVVFAACGDKTPERDEPSTIVGVDGQVYVEQTEVVTELVTEVVTEIVTEVVTDKQGEAITNSEGKTEVLSEVVSEIHSEVVTSVVTVTVPYESSTAETTTAVKQENTTSGAPSNEGSSVEYTTTYEDVTFPEGTLIEVEMGSDGKPKQTLMQSLVEKIKNKKEFTFDATFVAGEIAGFETGMPLKLCIKDENTALDINIAGLNIRWIMTGNKMYVSFPKAKLYVDAGEYNSSSSSSSDPSASADELWNIIDPENMNYIRTSRVKVKGITYTCEEFGDSSSVKKYYFNSKKELKRIELITSDNETVIIKISEFSANVDNKIFSVKGYKPISEDDANKMLEGMVGSLGGFGSLT